MEQNTAMAALDRLFGRAFGRPASRLSPARLTVVGLAGVLAVVGAAAILWPAPGSQLGGGPSRPPPSEAATLAEPTAVPHDLSAHDLFWDMAGVLGGGVDGPWYGSLADLGKRSEAIVLGSFTGEVERGREPCDEESVANGAPREQACVFFTNVTFRIDEVLAGSLPEQYRKAVKLEYMLAQSPDLALLPAAMPTDERIVVFIGSKYLRRVGIEAVYYAAGAGKGTFLEVDGRTWTVKLRDDPEFGRLDGMPFERFVELVRSVPVLDLMPEG